MKNCKRKTQVESKKSSAKATRKKSAKGCDVVIDENDIYNVEFLDVDSDTLVFPDCELYEDLPI